MSIKTYKTPAYDYFMSTIFDLPERDKLEYAIGACLAEDPIMKNTIVLLHGGPGLGKSSFLYIVGMIFRSGEVSICHDLDVFKALPEFVDVDKPIFVATNRDEEPITLKNVFNKTIVHVKCSGRVISSIHLYNETMERITYESKRVGENCLARYQVMETLVRLFTARIEEDYEAVCLNDLDKLFE